MFDHLKFQINQKCDLQLFTTAALVPLFSFHLSTKKKLFFLCFNWDIKTFCIWRHKRNFFGCVHINILRKVAVAGQLRRDQIKSFKTHLLRVLLFPRLFNEYLVRANESSKRYEREKSQFFRFWASSVAHENVQFEMELITQDDDDDDDGQWERERREWELKRIYGGGNSVLIGTRTTSFTSTIAPLLHSPLTSSFFNETRQSTIIWDVLLGGFLNFKSVNTENITLFDKKKVLIILLD